MPTHDPQHILEGWKETTLGEVVDITSSKRIFAEEYKSFGVPFYRGKEIIEKFNGGKISTELYITEEKYIEIESKFGAPKSGDMLLTSVGTIGIPYIVKNNERFYFKDGNLTWFRNFNGILNTFLFYWLTSGYGKEEIQRHKIGSTQEALTIVGLKSISIKLPPLPEQRDIADMLSSLDAKIELLREQNETLEKTAQTIFQEWFGRYSVDSPEDLPEGWRVGKLGEILKLSYGKALISENRRNDGFPVIGSSGVVGFHENFLVNGPGIVVGRKGNMGSTLWVEESFFPIDTTFYVEDLLGISSLYYHLLLLKSLDFSKIGSDSAVPGLNRDAAYSVKIIIPNNEKILEFIQIIKSILEKKSQNNSQIQSLSKTRDELLPRLMSGEVRV